MQTQTAGPCRCVAGCGDQSGVDLGCWRCWCAKTVYVCVMQGFLQQMETAMAKHPLFADTTPQEQDAATEVRTPPLLCSTCMTV